MIGLQGLRGAAPPEVERGFRSSWNRIEGTRTRDGHAQVNTSDRWKDLFETDV